MNLIYQKVIDNTFHIELHICQPCQVFGSQLKKKYSFVAKDILITKSRNSNKALMH